MVTKDFADIGAFKTSQLRNIGLTGPKMRGIEAYITAQRKGKSPNYGRR